MINCTGATEHIIGFTTASPKSTDQIKCTAIIPARSGSKGVSDKNIKYLAGKPLISYSIAAAYKSEMINRIIVSTDSEKYAEIAIKEGAEVPFLRPKEYSQDLSKDSEFFVHLINWL